MARIGEEGKKYGLILTGKSAQQSQPSTKSISKFFNQDSEDESDKNDNFKELKAGPSKMQAKMRKQTQIDLEKALAEDPNVFLYDEVYDDISSTAQVAKKEADRKEEVHQRKSKYAAKLLKAAATRQVEHEILQERKIQKERVAEAGQFDDKPVFVTESYKNKLNERKEIIRELEEKTAKEDVTQEKDLTKFYSSLLESRTSTSKPVETNQPLPKNTQSDIPNVQSTQSTTHRSYRHRKESTSSESHSDKDSDHKHRSRDQKHKHVDVSRDRHRHKKHSSDNESVENVKTSRSKTDVSKKEKHLHKETNSPKHRHSKEHHGERPKEKKKESTEASKSSQRDRIVVPVKDEAKIEEARQRYLDRKAVGIGPLIESDSD